MMKDRKMEGVESMIKGGENRYFLFVSVMTRLSMAVPLG
jgi:hypothetical protein